MPVRHSLVQIQSRMDDQDMSGPDGDKVSKPDCATMRATSEIFEGFVSQPGVV